MAPGSTGSPASAAPVIEMTGISKRFRLGRGWSRPAARELWALRAIDLAVHRGEVLGLIGPNGAGKSTLLKVLSRIVTPTAGRAVIRGRMASLLEVGTGFHPELTGRDNIYLNGSILGMRAGEIRRRFDEIVAFAGVERFLETPVKRYSSGMYVRLAFAVAAHLEPEILVVDEVLAVGDLAFQRKCLGKLRDISRGGRTVLFVSHNLAAVNAFCTRVARLEQGRLVDVGPTRGVVPRYIAEHFTRARTRRFAAEPGRAIQLRGVAIDSPGAPPGEPLYRGDPLELTIDFDVRELTAGAEVVVTLEQAEGPVLLQTRDGDRRADAVAVRQPGRYRAHVPLPGELLAAGAYLVRVGLERTGGWEILEQREALCFDLHHPEGDASAQNGGRERPGVLACDPLWRIEPLAPGPALATATAPGRSGSAVPASCEVAP